MKWQVLGNGGIYNIVDDSGTVIYIGRRHVNWLKGDTVELFDSDNRVIIRIRQFMYARLFGSNCQIDFANDNRNGLLRNIRKGFEMTFNHLTTNYFFDDGPFFGRHRDLYENGILVGRIEQKSRGISLFAEINCETEWQALLSSILEIAWDWNKYS